MAETLAFKAHARLLTMLGEQLIKNERIALVEIVKNSYDADARRVFVDFRDFSDDFEVRPDSSIVITDDGFGMQSEVVRDTWMRPATPGKTERSALSPELLLGEQFKERRALDDLLRSSSETSSSVISRAVDDRGETTLLIDISQLDDSGSGSLAEEMYLDQIAALFDVAKPIVFDGNGIISSEHGTQLEIRGLRSAWDSKLVREVFDDIGRLEPVMWNPRITEEEKTFGVIFQRDGVDLRLDIERNEEFQVLLERAVLKIEDGAYDPESREFVFSLQGKRQDLSIDDSDIRGLRVFRDQFLSDARATAFPQCGPFLRLQSECNCGAFP